MSTMDISVNRMLIRRASLLHMDNKTLPTHHEAVSNLGAFLGETVLSEMSPMAQRMMGIDTPFPVAPKTVWLSPGDKIDGNIMLKPPPNVDVIKALTHEGILEIGTTVEGRLEAHWQARIKAAKKEVEDFERFECNNRIQFALQQQKLAHELELKQQRVDLLKMFQKDRDELIEESKTELKTLECKLISEHKITRDTDVRLSVEQTQLSANEKINELTERINLLERELDDTKEMVIVKVEKRKNQDWKILHEMFIEMHRQFANKLTFLHNQHNAEIRQLYLEIKTKRVESGRSSLQTTSCNDDDLWDEGSLKSEFEEEKIEFSEGGKPFVISVCKVEGESSEEDQLNEDDHSSGSSFKCYKHRSKPKENTNLYEELFAQGTETQYSELFHTDNQTGNIPDLIDINTTDVSCNILRRLGLNFNVANIEKVKVEVDNLLLNVNKRGETKLLTVTDSLDLIAPEATNVSSILESKDSVQKPADPGREEYNLLMNRRKSQKIIDSKSAVPLTPEEYMNTLIPIPKYMTTERASISIWDYKAMNDEEWNDLLQELDNKLRAESTESSGKNKTVTVTSPNSMESLAAFEQNLNCDAKKPVRGILRTSVENKTDSEFLLQKGVFQTNEMQSLVKKLCHK